MMRMICFALILLGACSSQPKKSTSAIPRPFPAEQQKGVCYAHAFSDGGWGSTKDKETQERLQELGVSWISLTPFAFQQKRSSPTIKGISASFEGGESDERIREATKIAHSLGIKVMLKPHLWVGDGSWCGAIQPTDWKSWYASYETVVEHYAKLAQEIHADGFLIGNELGTATKQDPEVFRGYIKLARRHYDGPISYAANWDEFDRIPFWEDLDAIGVNSYWSLTRNKDASEEELYQGALKIGERLEAVASRVERPILLTEIGFRSVANSVIRPNTWPEHDREQSLDLEIQAKAYRAIFKALWGKPYFKGLYFWKILSDGSSDAEGMGGFSFLDKPAEKVVQEYFKP